jgi:thiol-disulfide isomerase/thioredoxin
MRRPRFIAAFLLAGALVSPALAAQSPAVGQPAPAFTYNLLNGHRLSQAALRGHPYVLWAVASWCPSCKVGSKVVGDHIDFLRAHGVRVVEMKLYNDLGSPGPGLQKFQQAVGAKAASANWYWGELTEKQTAALDPKGAPDIYYLVDARGKIAAIRQSVGPAASWDVIERFADSSANS